MRYSLFTLLAIGLLIFTQVASAALKDGIALFFSFDEKKDGVVKDLSGNGNDGVVKGDAKWTDGKDGGGMEFLKGQYVEIPPVENLSSGTISITAWVKTNFGSGGAGHYALIAGASNVPFEVTWGPESFWWGFQPDGLYTVDTCHGGWIGRLRLNVPYKEGEWHHYAVVLDNSDKSRTIFFDGKEVATDKKYNIPVNLIWQIGNGHGSGGGGAEYLDGTIDEVSMFNRALTEQEVADVQKGRLSAIFSPVAKKGELAISWGAIKKQQKIY